MSSITVSMKKIRSKIEPHQHINVSDAQGQITGVGGFTWPKFELIQAFMHVLLSCKNEDDRFKNEGASVYKISPIISLVGIF